MRHQLVALVVLAACGTSSNDPAPDAASCTPPASGAAPTYTELYTKYFYVYVGDLLFAGSIGRTDFPGGDYDALINGVRTKIFPLGDNYTVYPGHGPVTTVAQERKYNPFF